MASIEIAVPSSWTVGETLAMRALLQQSVSAGFPIVAAVRPGATPDQIEEIYARLGTLLRERGLAA
jgi:acyl-homoserine lactone acylase PvdQ